MHFAISIESITEHASFVFHKIADSGLETPSFRAESGIINQCIHGNIMFKLLFWLPYKKTNVVISKLFELDRSDYLLHVQAHGRENDTKYTVTLNGTVKHQFHQFLPTERTETIRSPIQSSCCEEERNENVISFSFRIEMERKENNPTILIMTERGKRQWQRQMQDLILEATHKASATLCTSRPLLIQSVVVRPFPCVDPWNIRFHCSSNSNDDNEDDDNDSSLWLARSKAAHLSISHPNYRIVVDIRAKSPLWTLPSSGKF